MEQIPVESDVIVVGGGHAGVEAAMASARLGAQTLLLTHNIETIGQMSCNPAIGGIGKGHLVKEIDALGGVMARAIDQAGIQFRILNSTKGPAVQATRAQADRSLYKQAIRKLVFEQKHLKLFQAAVEDLIVEKDQIVGVVVQTDTRFLAKAVVLTVGTFLGGCIHIGTNQVRAGRAGDPPSNALAQRLRARPFRVGRLKTGTPPRIDGRSIDYSVLEEQPGDQPLPVFSFLGSVEEHPQQVSCHIAQTNSKTHEIIQANLQHSPIYGGAIESVGPRYCPSIEDKIVRFADRSSHQIFVEPEGLQTVEIYPNGISTSLPFEVQQAFVRSIQGFEQAHITRPGYAIEYDFFDPRDLTPSLETTFISGLFFAGQINGTTGYEEAAAQGLLAGANAARKVLGETSFELKRSDGYLGVLIDDLITLGTKEPYRMFTSRAEYRLLLREDNADLRLTEKGYALGLVDKTRWQAFVTKRDQILAHIQTLEKTWIQPGTKVASVLAEQLTHPIERAVQLRALLVRPEMSMEHLCRACELVDLAQSAQAVREQVEIQIKYAGYIERQQKEIARNKRAEHLKIPAQFDFDKISGLSSEIKEKLKATRPKTLAQAARIPGVTPAAISLLSICLKKQGFFVKDFE